MLFLNLRHFLQLFAEKLIAMSKHGSLLQKAEHFGPNRRFLMLFAKWRTFCNFLLKNWPKRRDIVVCSRKLQILAKSTFFSCFLEKCGTFCWNVDPNGKTWWFARERCKFLPYRRFYMRFHKMGHFFHFFSEKFTQTPTHGGFLEEVASVGKIDDFSCFFR